MHTATGVVERSFQPLEGLLLAIFGVCHILEESVVLLGDEIFNTYNMKTNAARTASQFRTADGSDKYIHCETDTTLTLG